MKAKIQRGLLNKKITGIKPGKEDNGKNAEDGAQHGAAMIDIVSGAEDGDIEEVEQGQFVGQKIKNKNDTDQDEKDKALFEILHEVFLKSFHHKLRTPTNKK